MHNNIQLFEKSAATGKVGVDFSLFRIGEAGDENLKNTGGRNGKQHTDNSPETAENTYGQQNEEGVDACSFADNFRVDIIGIDLLDEKESENGGNSVKKTF